MTDAEHAPPTVVHALIRVWVSDRPGALGLVASRIGAVRGDIMAIDVLERGDEVAIDEFAVNLPSRDVVDVLVREIEEVDGASVEEWRFVDQFPDPATDALESVERICDSSSFDELAARLVERVHGEFHADWAVLVCGGNVLAATGPAPPAAALPAPAAGTRTAPLPAGAESSDLAVAPLPGRDALLVLGRGGHPFRQREHMQLLSLARVAERVAARLTPEG